jgi:hypothetical protein
MLGQGLKDAISTELHHACPGLLVLVNARFQAGYPCRQSLQHKILSLLGCFERYNTSLQVLQFDGFDGGL